MRSNGVKRKLEPSVSEDDRRALLSLSLIKLYGHQTGADLDLRRHVLVGNLIHRIHDDSREDGCGAPAQNVRRPDPPPPPPPPSSLTPASLLEEKPRENIWTAVEDEEELSPSSLSPPLSPTRVFFDIYLKEEGRGPEGSPPTPAAADGSPPPSPGVFLMDLMLDDPLFTDLDASMLDLAPWTRPPQGQTHLPELDHIMEVLVGS